MAVIVTVLVGVTRATSVAVASLVEVTKTVLRWISWIVRFRFLLRLPRRCVVHSLCDVRIIHEITTEVRSDIRRSKVVVNILIACSIVLSRFENGLLK